MAIGALVCLLPFSPILLIYISVLVPVPYSIDNCSCVYSLKSESLMPTAQCFLIKIALVIRGFCVLTQIIKYFVLTLWKKKKDIGNLIGLALNLWTALGNVVISTILMLQI